MRGRVTKAHQLSSIVEIVEDDVRKLATILSDIYEKVGRLFGVDY